MKLSRFRNQGRSRSEVSTGEGGLVSVQVESVRWWVLSGFQGRMIGSQTPDWNHPRRDSRADLVKSNPRREVYRFRHDDRVYYIKFHYAKELGEKLKWRLWGPPARREFGFLSLARKHNVPAACPLGWGAGRVEGTQVCMLITESLGEVVSLEDILWSERPLGRDFLENCLGATGRLIARIQHAGMEHPDLHMGNILLSTKAVDEQIRPEAFITDLQGVRLKKARWFFPRRGGPLDGALQSWRMWNVAVLLGGIQLLTEKFRGGGDPRSIENDPSYRFITEYLETTRVLEKYVCPKLGQKSEAEEKVDSLMPLQDRTERDYLRRLVRLIRRRQRQFIRRRDRRCLRNTRYAGEIELSGSWRGHVFLRNRYPVAWSRASRHDFTLDQWRRVLSDPENLLCEGRPLKKGGRNTVLAREITIGEVRLPVVLKQSRLYSGPPRWANRIRGFFRSLWQIVTLSRAHRQWRLAHGLLGRHLPTAWPLAALQKKQGLITESIVICEEIQGAQNLDQLIRTKDRLDNYFERADLARTIGVLLAKLKYWGLRHRDCKATNIMVRHKRGHSTRKPGGNDECNASSGSMPEGKWWQAFFIDLDGIRLPGITIRPLGHEALVRLGASLYSLEQVTLRDFAGVFRAYIRYLELPEAHDRILRRRLWFALARAIERRIQRSVRYRLQHRLFKNILLIKPSSLGDVVRTLPVLHFLRQRYPRARISWLIRTDLAGFLKGQPDLDEIIPFDRKYFGKMTFDPGAALAFWRFLGRLRRKRFDLVLDLQGLFRSGFLGFITGAPVRMGFARAREMAPLFYNVPVKTPGHREHVVESYWRFTDMLRPDVTRDQKIGPQQSLREKSRVKTLQEINFVLPSDPRIEALTAEKLRVAGLTPRRRYIVFVPGGTEAAKQWPPERFAALAHWLTICYDVAIVLVGAGAGEMAIADEICAAVPLLRNESIPTQDHLLLVSSPPEIVNLVGKTGLPEMIAVLRRADMVIGNDSGPLHVAAALSVPVLGLYGPTDPLIVGPYLQLDRVVRPGPDRPQTQRYSPAPEHRMSYITLEQVIGIVEKRITADPKVVPQKKPNRPRVKSGAPRKTARKPKLSKDDISV